VDLPQLLPPLVRQKISEQVKDATRAAAKNFDYNAADEDSLTGALVDKLADRVNGALDDWSWSVRPYRVSSNLEEGGEGEIGADLIVQVDVYKGGINTAQKLVPIQAKKLWQGKDLKLAKQANDLCAFPGSGIVADYRPGSYLAVRAEVARDANANRASVPDDKVEDLGTVLGDHFLECRIGTRDGYINDRGTDVVFPDRRIRIRPPYHVARLKVSQTKRSKSR
jgi:hypothetical protein